MYDEMVYNSEISNSENKYTLNDIFSFKGIGRTRDLPDIGLYLSQQQMFIFEAKIVKAVPTGVLPPDPELLGEKPSSGGSGLSKLKSLVRSKHKDSSASEGVKHKKKGNGEGTFYRVGPDGEIVELTVRCRDGGNVAWGSWDAI
jgi:hypothetical protein